MHTFLSRFENRIGSWVNAEFILMITIGILTYLGLALLSITYALPLAIIAGFLEVVPNIGPTISTILASLIGLTVSPYHAVLAAIWGIVVQQLENNFIVPKVMNSTVGLNPIMTIFILIAGSNLGGVIGAILSVPIYLTIEIIIQMYNEHHSQNPKNIDKATK
jgi:predicted PurR-regulated permease PerM